MEQVVDDAVWEALERLRQRGLIRHYGIALGPAIGWLYEGINCLRKRPITSLQHIYNLLEQHPGATIQNAAVEDGKKMMFLVRVPHSSGMLEGHYTMETRFSPTDHRSHRPRSWLTNGVRKVEQLRFLERADRTLGQAALLWLLKDQRIASILPNIYDEKQLTEFVTISKCPDLTDDDMEQIATLHADNFGIEGDESPKFKGTMELQLNPSK